MSSGVWEVAGTGSVDWGVRKAFRIRGGRGESQNDADQKIGIHGGRGERDLLEGWIGNRGCAEEGVGREDGGGAGVDGGERGDEGTGFCRGKEMV